VAVTPPLRISERLLGEVVAHARAGLPNEACGILAGVAGEASRYFPAVNADASPYRYSIAGDELLGIVTAIEDAGEEVVAICHSHTRSPARPSATDVELAFWPDAAYLIVSLLTAPAQVKAFTIRDQRVSSRALVIAPA
jgi:[CysO sulfur-carrier protein]-S-L-cysteine hydrolase